MLRFAEFYASGAAVLGARQASQIPVAAVALDADEALVVNSNFMEIPTYVGLTGVRPVHFPRFEIAYVGLVPESNMKDFLSIIYAIRPRALIHSLRGIIYSKALIYALMDLGYGRQSDRYAATGFGLPQYATRSFMLFLREDVKPGEYFHWPDPGPMSRFHLPTAESLLRSDKRPSASLWLTEKQLERLRKSEEKNRKAGFGYRTRIVRYDEPFPEIPLHYHKHYSILLYHNGWGHNGPRRLSPREIGVVQGFPDDWKMPLPKTKAYSILGRAPWPPVIQAILKELDEWLI